MKDAEKQGTDQPGFCPKVVETFLNHTRVLLESQDALYQVLLNLVAGQLEWAVYYLKVLRYSSVHSDELFSVVERQVYLALGQPVEVSK